MKTFVYYGCNEKCLKCINKEERTRAWNNEGVFTVICPPVDDYSNTGDTTKVEIRKEVDYLKTSLMGLRWFFE